MDIKDSRKKKKGGKWIKALIIILAIIILIFVAILLIFPGMFFPQKLGINYDDIDYNDVASKIEANSIIDAELTSEEITAYVNKNVKIDTGIQNTEVKVNPDNSIEAVGTVDMEYFLKNVLNNKYTEEQLAGQIPGFNLLPNNINLYLKLNGSIVNNSSDINVQEVRVQGITIPNSILNSINIDSSINSLIDKEIKNTGITIDNVSVQNGKLYLNGEK